MSGGSQSEGASNSASPASSVALSNPSSTQGINNNAPKYGTLVPNRIFVGGISSNTTEAELCQLFSKYGNVKATKIIADRAGVSKGYGFVTFESEEEAKYLTQDTNNIVLKERRLNIAPAIKKQPCNRSFDASTPPPTTPNLYFHNGVPYTFHNGMAFFPPTAHQPPLAALPPSADPSMYPSYGPTHGAAPTFGTPVLLHAPPPVYLPQNYSYQPMQMTNGGPTQFIYTGSGSPNSSSGSPMAGTPENPHLPAPMHQQFYASPYAAQEAFFPQPYFIGYAYNSGEYEPQDQQTTNDDCSSTVSTPRSDMSERSSIRSPPSNIPVQPQFVMNKSKIDTTGPSTEMQSNNRQNTTTPPNTDSQVPVVSWQNLKNSAEERELHIKDGRRAFHRITRPPPSPVSQVVLFQQQPIPNLYPNPNSVYQHPKQNQIVDYRGQRQNMRGRSRGNILTNNKPFIPEFPVNFNNNNPSAMNNNHHDKKPVDLSNGRPHRFMNNSRRGSKVNHYSSPPSPNPSNTNSFVSSPSPQIMQPPQTQHYDRQYGAGDRSIMVANSNIRWPSNPPNNSHQMKRLINTKRQNGSIPNSGMNNSGNVRLAKNTQTIQESVEGDMGGGGDAQPMIALTPPSTPSTGANNQEVTSKMQSLSLGNSM